MISFDSKVRDLSTGKIRRVVAVYRYDDRPDTALLSDGVTVRIDRLEVLS